MELAVRWRGAIRLPEVPAYHVWILVLFGRGHNLPVTGGWECSFSGRAYNEASVLESRRITIPKVRSPIVKTGHFVSRLVNRLIDRGIQLLIDSADTLKPGWLTIH
jgi:hypothetical protein